MDSDSGPIGKGPKIDIITRKLHFEGPELTEAHKEAMLRIADRCPVHKTLHAQVAIDTTMF